MNDSENKNSQVTDQKLLQEVRQRKLLGNNETQITEELASLYGQKQIQKALAALSYMQAPNAEVNGGTPINRNEEPVENKQKMYTQQILHIILVIIAYQIIVYLLGWVFWAIAPSSLSNGQGFAKAPNLAGAAILSFIGATITFLFSRKRFGLTAFTVLLTIVIFQLYTYARYAIYLAR